MSGLKKSRIYLLAIFIVAALFASIDSYAEIIEDQSQLAISPDIADAPIDAALPKGETPTALSSAIAADSGGVEQSPAQKAAAQSSSGGSGSVTPDLFSGTMSNSIPIDVPLGRNGMEPKLSLLYRSSNGNGWLGMGWELEAGAIVRITKSGVKYDGDDYMLRLPGASMDLVNIGGGEYRAKIEGSFNRIRKLTAADGKTYWEVTDKKGNRYLYGQTTASRQDDQADATRIFKWCMDSVTDTDSNSMTFSYTKDQGQIYLDQINYPANNYVKFYTESRTDTPVMFTTNFAVTTAKRLKAIEVKGNGNQVRAYKLNYSASGSTSRSLLASVQQYGKDYTLDGSGTVTRGTALPAVTLNYQSHNGGLNTYTRPGLTVSGPDIWSGDFNGDGKTDILFYENGYPLGISYGGNLNTYSRLGWSLSTNNASGPAVWPGDFDGDGKTDILFAEDGYPLSISYGSNLNAYSRLPWAISKNGSIGYRVWLGDFNGDGKTDILFYESGYPLGISYGGNLNSYGRLNLSISNNGGSGPAVWLGDFDGDGKTDILFAEDGYPLSISYGSNLNAYSRLPWAISKNGSIGYRVWLGNFNGDGKTDILFYESGYSLSISYGGNLNSYGRLNLSISNNGGSGPAVWPGDFDGDGKTDILFAEDGYPLSISYGSNLNAYSRLPWGISKNGSIGYRVWSGDFKGGGINGMLFYESGFALGTSNNTPFPDLLTSITNGLGATTTITYKPSTQYDGVTHSQLPFPVQTVYKVNVSDGNGNNAETTFKYEGGFYHIGEKDFRGFNRVTVTGPVGPNGEKAVTEAWYHQGDDVAVDVNNLLDANGIELPTNGYMKGKPYRLKVSDGSGNKYSETTTSYGSDNTAPYFNPQYEVNAYSYDGNSTPGKQTRTVYSYDTSYGNLTREDQYGDSNDSTDDRTVVRTFANNTTPWLIGFPTNESVYQGIGTTTPVASTDYYYDGGVTDCSTASTNQTPTKGKLTRVIRRYLTDSTKDAETRMAYYSNGNLYCSRDANGNTSSVTYDTTTNTYPKTATNPLNQQTTTTYYGIDVSGSGLYGQLQSIKDVDNNVTTSYEYDNLGRRTTVTNPDGTYATTTYNSFGTVNLQNVQTTTSAGLLSTTYFDGLGRTILEKSTGPDSKTIARKTVYGSRGAVYQTSLPYFDTDTPKYSTYAYDTVGRVKSVLMPDSTTSQACYNSGVTVTIDANNHKKRETKDASGRLVRVDEYTGTYTTCDTSVGSPYATTRYTYDRLGNLLTVTDENTNQTSMTYDTLGRKKTMHDPDMGNWNYYYDKNGNLTSQVDSMGQWIYFQYDVLNRLRQKDYSTQKALGYGDIVYNYDQATSYGKGRLTSMTDQSGSATYYYDNMGRSSRTDKTVNGSTYTTQYGYDTLGRPNAVTYPDNATINYNYNGPLLSSAYEGSTTYAAYAGYNALGQPGSITYANGVVTNYTYSSSGNPTCTADNYRLCTINTAKSGSTYQNKRYAYDNIGNVSAFYDSINGDQSFTYDSINRLETVLSGAYGSITYAYDKIGNMTTNTQVGTYMYPTNGIRPHAVSTAGGNSYSYDNNGNMTSGAGRTITYDPENRPMTITTSGITTTFYYDGNGERVKKTSGGNTTVYIGKLYECTGSSCEKFIFANGQRIAKKTAGTGTIYYYHSDHLGSSSVVTDVSGNQAENLAYYPYGQSRIDSAPGVSHHKYTDQELDAETGLYFYNARYYDPALGRFISADSIIPDPSDPQAFNRYSYVLNNPIRYTDPSGHGSFDVGDWHVSWSDKDQAGVEVVAGIALIAATPVCPYCGVVGGPMVGHGMDTLGANVESSGGTGVSIDSDGNVNPVTISSGGGPGGSGTMRSDGIGGAGGSSSDPTYYGHLVLYGSGDISWGPFSRISGDGPDTISLNPRGRVGGGSITSGPGFPKNVMDSLYTEAYRLRNNDGRARVDLAMDVLTVVAVNAVGYQTGFEFTFGKNFRLAPWGNRTGNPYGELPHYHRRIFGPNGKVIDGGAMKWHRPWENGW